MGKTADLGKSANGLVLLGCLEGRRSKTDKNAHDVLHSEGGRVRPSSRREAKRTRAELVVAPEHPLVFDRSHETSADGEAIRLSNREPQLAADRLGVSWRAVIKGLRRIDPDV